MTTPWLISLVALAIGATPGRAPGDVRSFLIKVSMSTTDAKGRTEVKPTLVARTLVVGDSARADILEGYGDFATGDLMMTQDGGHRLFLVRSAHRTYSESYPDSMGPALARATTTGTLKARADSVQVQFRRLADEVVAGVSTSHYLVIRRYDVLVTVLFLKKRIRTEEQMELWLARDPTPLPNPVGRLFTAILDAPSFAAPELVRHMAAIRDSLGGGAPLRIRHRLTTGTPGNAVVTTTTIEVSDLRQESGARPSFALLPAWRRVAS